MFQRSNSDFIQKNSTRSAKNFQERENCKGIFLFFFLSNILFLYDIFSGNSCRITDSTVNQNSLKPYKSMSGSRTSSINITQKLARNA